MEKFESNCQCEVSLASETGAVPTDAAVRLCGRAGKIQFDQMLARVDGK